MVHRPDADALPYRDASRPVAQRVDDLVARMTLEEKVAQLTSVAAFGLAGEDGISEERVEQRLADGIGHVSMASGWSHDPEQLTAAVNEVQRFLVERTRLGIPAIFHGEGLAGFTNRAAADFPTAIGLAAAWDPASVEEMAAVIREQARSLGFVQLLSPVLDVARDARWGRVQETYGEDPYLASATGVAFVRGLQGPDLQRGVCATGKHFAGYGFAEGGRNLVPVHLGPRELRDVYARPFAAAMHEAGLASVMCAYSDLDGEPIAGSRRVLTELLRHELGFDGVVVSDYFAIDFLHNRQHSARDPLDAAIQALSAGLDVELPERTSYDANLVEAIRRGDLDESIIDLSVRRALEVKLRLGLFEAPYASLDAFTATGGRAAGRDVARRLAERSIVLLDNERGVLPLRSDVRRIAVIGPNADSVRNLFGHYSAAAEIETMHAFAIDADASMAAAFLEGTDDDSAVAIADWARFGAPPPAAAIAEIEAAYGDTPTVLGAIRAGAPAGVEVVHVAGCGINDPATDGIAAAVALAERADVAVLVLGDKTGMVFDATAGETRDRSTLELPGAQRPLLDAVCATGTPVVVVLVGSRPVPVIAAPDGPAAVLVAWLPGSIGGVAVADVLFGTVNPSGKLPITIPRTAGQCPIYHGHKPGGESLTYTDLDDSGPAYPFGHGRSYTTFAYRSIDVAQPRVAPTGDMRASVAVMNTGDRCGEEVVQLYAHVRRRGVTRPVRELVGFARVELDAGSSADVVFDVPVELLAYHDADMRLVVAPGEVRLLAGGSSADLPIDTMVDIEGDTIVLPRRTKFLAHATVVHHDAHAAR